MGLEHGAWQRFLNYCPEGAAFGKSKKQWRNPLIRIVYNKAAYEDECAYEVECTFDDVKEYLNDIIKQLSFIPDGVLLTDDYFYFVEIEDKSTLTLSKLYQYYNFLGELGDFSGLETGVLVLNRYGKPTDTLSVHDIEAFVLFGANT